MKKQTVEAINYSKIYGKHVAHDKAEQEKVDIYNGAVKQMNEETLREGYQATLKTYAGSFLSKDGQFQAFKNAVEIQRKTLQKRFNDTLSSKVICTLIENVREDAILTLQEANEEGLIDEKVLASAVKTTRTYSALVRSAARYNMNFLEVAKNALENKTKLAGIQQATYVVAYKLDDDGLLNMPAPFVPDDESIVDESIVDESIVDESIVDESIVDESIVDESIVDESIVDESIVDESNVDESIVDESNDDESIVDESNDDESNDDESNDDESNDDTLVDLDDGIETDESIDNLIIPSPTVDVKPIIESNLEAAKIPHVISKKELAYDTLESLADVQYNALSGAQKRERDAFINAFVKDEMSAQVKAAAIAELLTMGYFNDNTLDILYANMAELAQKAA